MNRRDFGRLVAALRKEQLDDNLEPMSQKKLGDLTKLGELTIGKIERGSRVNLTQDELVRLADALELTTGERREFFLASSGVSSTHLSRNIMDDAQTFDEFTKILHNIEQPAFISDEYYDALALNHTVMNLWQMPVSFFQNIFSKSANTNVMRFFFSQEFSKQHSMMGHAWEGMATYNLRRFRSHTLRFRDDPYLKTLLKELWSYPKFKQYWRTIFFSNEDYHIDGMRFDIEIDRHKYAFVLTSMKAYTTRGMLELYVYSPISPQTSQLFNTLFQSAGPGYCQFKTWPDKQLTPLFLT